jgi:hypothetical protein
MKKLLLPLFFLLLLAGCKDDKNDYSPSLREQMKGDWDLNMLTVEFYDAMKSKVEETNVPVESYHYTFKDDNVEVRTPPKSDDYIAPCSYHFRDGKYFVTTALMGNSSPSSFEVTKITPTEMTLTITIPYSHSHGYGTSKTTTATSATHHFKFIRP